MYSSHSPKPEKTRQEQDIDNIKRRLDSIQKLMEIERELRSEQHRELLSLLNQILLFLPLNTTLPTMVSGPLKPPAQPEPKEKKKKKKKKSKAAQHSKTLPTQAKTRLEAPRGVDLQDFQSILERTLQDNHDEGKKKGSGKKKKR